jgi:hypothetical protein
MTKPADDKLGHAKREIKALRLQLDARGNYIERLELWRAEDKFQYELLEALVESCSKRNESDCDLIDNLQDQVSELVASAVVPEGWKLVPMVSTTVMDLAALALSTDVPDDFWKIMIAASPLPPNQEPAE